MGKVIDGKEIKRIYLSGKMSGIPEFNFPLFNKYAKAIRAIGYYVVNPAENPPESSWANYLKRDIPLVLGCDAVAVLDGWETSPGAQLEVYVARKVGIPILRAGDFEPLSQESPLDEARRLVHGDRQQDYGHPFYDFACTAGIWTALFSRRYPGQGIVFTAEDVAEFMIGVKLSRQMHAPKRDNIVDIIGYSECLWMVQEMSADLGKTKQAAASYGSSEAVEAIKEMIKVGSRYQPGTNGDAAYYNDSAPSVSITHTQP